MTAPRAPARGARREAGASLLEILIAVFVLSIGLLGAGSLQMVSSRSNHEALQRGVATALLQDMVERMRANSSALDTYTALGVGRSLDGDDMAAQSCDTDCTAAQLSAFDLYEWEQALAGVAETRSGSNVGGLLAPTACITGPAGGDGIYTVSIAWRGLTSLSDPVANSCGQGSGLYDSSDGAQADVHRRLISFTTYISAF